MVGFGSVSQHTPTAKTILDPSEVTVPPQNAEVSEMFETDDVKTEGVLFTGIGVTTGSGDLFSFFLQQTNTRITKRIIIDLN